jgi:CheY-like chemotaxis protein/anti-sigma regulatory factor (Ser/Thr protein kinase)
MWLTCRSSIRKAATIRGRANDRALDVVLPPHAVHVAGDSTRLVQVVGNLLSNALKFTEPGGRIRLELSEEDRWAVLRVRDTGIGIPANQLERIFEMFVQLDTSFERERGGLGIGLSLVKKLVEQHGGTVAAQSDGPGTGTAFTVRLPLAAAASESGPPRPPIKSGSAPRRILVVDDNRDSADMLSVVLGLAGHDVLTAYDGAGALEKAAAFNPNVVLMDIGMPGLNGYEVARRLRERHGNALRLVALTGWGQDADRRRSREAGFDAHLVKPVDLERIDDLLAGWAA